MHKSTAWVRVIADVEELHSFQEEWDSLLGNYSPATTFSSLEWLIAWWQSFAVGQQMLVFALFDFNADASPRLLGVAPLSISKEKLAKGVTLKVMRLMGDGSGDSDNLDIPVLPGFEGHFATVLWDYLSQHKSEWDICQLNTLPMDSAVAGILIDKVNAGGGLHSKYQRECSAIPLPTSWEQYLEVLTSEDRKNLERYSRRLQKRYSTRIYRCSELSELPAALDALFRLHQLRWEQAGEPGSFSSSARREFYQVLSRKLLARKQLEVWVLDLDGAIAAVQFAFRFGDRVFQLQEGNDPARSSDRVGFILRGEVLKQLIAEGVRSYDFLGGTDPYKGRWGAQTGFYKDLHFARKFSKGGAYLWTADNLGKTKSKLRRTLPPQVWRVMHKINVSMRGIKTDDRRADQEAGATSASENSTSLK